MKFKKVIALMLTTVLSLSALTGCGGKDSQESKGGNDTSSAEESSSAQDETDGSAEGSSQAEGESGGAEGESASGTVTLPLAETMTFTAFAGMNGDYTMTDNIAMQKSLADANINIEFTNVLGADLDEKRNLVLNSGDYPDIFYKSNVDAAKYGLQGVMIPLEDLIRQYAPNLTALLDERDGWQYITAADGHVYSIPEIDLKGVANPAYWINKRWMDNLGLEEPTSFEELYDVLKAFKEQDANGNGDPNDEIPLFCNTYCNPLMLMQYQDFPYSAWEKLGIIDGKLAYVPATEEYREFLAFVTRLYQDGLMDPNSFTQPLEQQAPTGQSGDVMGSFFDAGAFLTVGRDHDEDYIALTPWDDCLQLSSGITANTLAITDACEHPEVVIAWADTLYTEEGGRLAWMGVEGETYQYNDQGEWEWITGKGHGDDISTVRASSTMQGAQNHPSVQPEVWMTDMSSDIDPDEVYLNAQRMKLMEHGVVPLPNLVFTEEQNAELSVIKTDIDNYITEYMAKVATGETTLDDSWDEYIETLKAMGTERMFEIYQEVYDAAIAD